MSFEIDLTESRALVTGGGQSVGRATCLALASAGASVVVNDYVAERAEGVVEEIRAAGGSAQAAPFDVTDFEAVTDGVGRSGAVDILVNNAGNAGASGFKLAPFHESTPQDWERYFGVNLYGVMHCTHAALPGMIQQNRGRVITIVSDAGRSGEPRMAAYSAAKAGAAGFTRSVARDVARFGITVNNIALATIDTTGARSDGAELDSAAQDALKKQLRNYIVKRLGRPDDVAAMVTFLASPLTTWITGQTYPVNGGYTVTQ